MKAPSGLTALLLWSRFLRRWFIRQGIALAWYFGHRSGLGVQQSAERVPESVGIDLDGFGH